MDSASLRLAVFTWGNPARWYFVGYEFEGVVGSGFSTLSIVEASPSLSPDDAIVFTLDSLYADMGGGPGSSGCPGYGEIVSGVEEYVERYLCTEKSEPSVVVLPGRLSSRSFSFEGKPRDLRSLALYWLVEKTTRSSSREGELRLLTDVTHGLNYFITIIQGAVYEAAAIASTARAAQSAIEVYSADPVKVEEIAKRLARSPSNPCEPAERTEPPLVKYERITKHLVKPWDLVRYMRYHGNTGKLISDSRGCQINGEILTRARRLVAAFRVGATLRLAELVLEDRDWSETAWSELEKTVECWLSKASVEKTGEKCITSFRSIEEGFRVLLHAYAIHMGASRILDEDAEDGVKLESLKKLKEKLMAGSEIVGRLFDKEFGILLDKLEKSAILGEWRVYNSIISTTGEPCDILCSNRSQDDFQRCLRNFIAHAGFLADMVEVKRLDGGVSLRTRTQCSSIVDEFLDSIFNDMRESS